MNDNHTEGSVDNKLDNDDMQTIGLSVSGTTNTTKVCQNLCIFN